MWNLAYRRSWRLIIPVTAGALLAVGAAPAQEPVSGEPAALTAAVGAPRQAAIVPITGEISDVTTESIERRVQRGRGHHL